MKLPYQLLPGQLPPAPQYPLILQMCLQAFLQLFQPKKYKEFFVESKFIQTINAVYLHHLLRKISHCGSNFWNFYQLLH